MSNLPETQREANALRVLVVDDSRAQRMVLAATLKRAGHDVTEAGDGREALELCREHSFDLILSDWVMPEMTGPEFCEAFRKLGRDDYAYFILLTSKSERADIAKGLELGADDFLTKPVNAAELRARIQAGARIVQMQHELTDKNRVIGDTLKELQSLYDLIDSDLMEARKLQQSLVRDRYRDFGAGQMSLMLRSSGHVGGDLVGYFQASDRMLGLYSLDVSGHGITSAMMTARLAGHLSSNLPEHNIALSPTKGGSYKVLPCDEVISKFNEMMTTVIETDHYFTIALCVIDLQTGRVRMTQAGHPHPVVQRANGETEVHGRGGMPVGLIEEAQFEQFEFSLCPGDRLFICSDGVTECPAEGDFTRLLDEEGLNNILKRNKDVTGPALMEALIWDLSAFHGSDGFPDDVSAVLFEYSGAPASAPTLPE